MKRDLNYYLSLNYPVEIIREEGGVFAFHPDLDGCAAQGATIDEAVENLDAARKLWLQVRLEDGRPVEEPVNETEYSGRVSLRMPPSLHGEMVKISRRQHMSLNQLINNILSEYAGGNRLREQVVELVQDIAQELRASSAVASPTLTSSVQQQTFLAGASVFTGWHPVPQLSGPSRWTSFGKAGGTQ